MKHAKLRPAGAPQGTQRSPGKKHYATEHALAVNSFWGRGRTSAEECVFRPISPSDGTDVVCSVYSSRRTTCTIRHHPATSYWRISASPTPLLHEIEQPRLRHQACGSLRNIGTHTEQRNSLRLCAFKPWPCTTTQRSVAPGWLHPCTTAAEQPLHKRYRA